MSFITLERMDRMAAEIEGEIGVGKVSSSRAYKEWRAAIEKAQREEEERKARERPRQMMDADEVAEALGVSKSSAYKYIARLNKELEEADYLTVRGKCSRAYFEKRTYGIGAG